MDYYFCVLFLFFQISRKYLLDAKQIPKTKRGKEDYEELFEEKITRTNQNSEEIENSK